jgi:hypothetical protein
MSSTPMSAVAVTAAFLAMLGASAQPARSEVPAVVKPPVAAPAQVRVWHGTVREVHGTNVLLALRNGKTVMVDAKIPEANEVRVLLTQGRHIIVKGDMSGGIVHATEIFRLNQALEFWPADR